MHTSKTVSYVLLSLVLTALSQSASAAGNQHLVFLVKGTGVTETRDIDTDGDGINDTTAGCHDVQLYDPSNGLQIGEATDCLSEIVVESYDADGAPNISLTGTTFFNLPGGTLVTQGLTTVRPVLQPTFRDAIDYTHITGSNSDSGVQYGTQKFQNAEGKARLSGQVDLSVPGQITFNCIFIVDLETT